MIVVRTRRTMPSRGAVVGTNLGAVIARALFISEATVKTHLGRIYGKLGVETPGRRGGGGH
ncbi:hypothetical protein SANTM175S_02171 [Streptomyces antimycoticus]